MKQAYLQGFCFLIAVDTDLNILGISENALSLIQKTESEIVHTHIKEYYFLAFPHLVKKHYSLLQRFITEKLPKQIVLDPIDETYYYFSVSKTDKIIYIEWEEQTKNQISGSEMTGLGFLFDRSYFHDWTIVCKTICDLLEYDQAVVFGISDDGKGKAIAEYSVNGTLEYFGKELSSLVYSPEVSAYYQSLSYRYNPNFNSQKQSFYFIEEDLDLLCSQLARTPELHALYLQHKGVHSLVTFPLFLDQEFWGIIAVYANEARTVDRQRRKFCSFIASNAMRKYENTIKQSRLEYKEQFTHVNKIVETALNEMKTVNCAMASHMDLLSSTMKADGMAIFYHGDLFHHGLTPSENQLIQIVDFLQNQVDKRIFKDHNFRLNRQKYVDEKLPFAGMLGYCVDTEKEHYLLWFRKEHISTILDLNVFYEKKDVVKTEKEKLYIEKKITDSALPWEENEIYFVENLHQIITQSIISKNKEREKFTENLKSFNNELEMLTHTFSHDLKNPLSILKMGVQFLNNPTRKMSFEKQKTWYKSMLESIENIETIINNTVILSESRIMHFIKEPIPMASKIHNICKEACLIYKAENCQFHFGPLSPIWGEKSALYQIFLNIITNAVKYSSFVPHPQVWIHSIRNDKKIIYTIRDNGIGIPSEYIPLIFEKFYRAENTEKFEGMGIGLALAKRIVERLEGSIHIESEEDKGTIVTLEFPLISEFPSSMIKNQLE